MRTAEKGTVSQADERSHSDRLASPEIRHLNQEQLAQRLGVSQPTLEGWRHRGKGPAYLRLEGWIAYRVIDVVAVHSCETPRYGFMPPPGAARAAPL